MRKRIIILPLLLSIALLITASSFATYAWLTALRRSECNGLDIQIDGNSLLAMPMTTYWRETNDDGYTVYQKSTDIEIVLPTYDSVFVEKNDDCRIFVRVPVFGATVNRGDKFTVTLSLKDEHQGTFADNRNLFEYDSENDKMSKHIALYLSNVVCIKCAPIPGLNEASDGDEQSIVDQSAAFFAGNDSSISKGTFITTEGSTASKAIELRFTVSDYSEKRIKLEEENTYLLYLYFEFSYDEDLVTAMMETRELKLGETTLNIESDFEKLILNIDNNN